MTLLDTHTWIWWVSDPRQLSSRARKAIDRATDDGRLFLSSISAWEVAMLVAKGRLELTMTVEDWVAHSEGLPFLTFIPVDNRIAITSVRLPIHPDPADRIILATALSLGANLVTKDRKLSRVSEVKTVW